MLKKAPQRSELLCVYYNENTIGGTHKSSLLFFPYSTFCGLSAFLFFQVSIFLRLFAIDGFFYLQNSLSVLFSFLLKVVISNFFFFCKIFCLKILKKRNLLYPSKILLYHPNHKNNIFMSIPSKAQKQ